MKKTYFWSLVAVVFSFFLATIRILAQDSAPNFSYSPRTDSLLDLGITAPPFVAWVVDGQGRVTGADPNGVTNSVGEQVATFPWGRHDIPDSMVQQENEVSGDAGQTQSTTAWIIRVKISAPQTYMVNIKGIALGEDALDVRALFPGSQARQSLNFLLDAGTLRTLQIGFDPAQHRLTTERVIGDGDLLGDVLIACRLNEIRSARVCSSLERQAKLIQKALEGGHSSEARATVEVFLHFLGESRPEGCRDEDDHGAIGKTALDVLREDAKALLENLGGRKGLGTRALDETA